MSLLVLLGLLLAAWIVDWIVVFRLWPEGLARLQATLAQDLARVTRLECWCDDLPKFATGTANLLYSLLFVMTGIHDISARFADGAAVSVPDTIVRKTFIYNYDAIRVAMVGTQLFGVRLAALLTTVPFVAMVYGISLVDGLTQRAIRRMSGGRESANLYHRAKHLQPVLLTTTAALSLLLPVSMDPRSLWLSSAVLVAILARIQWASYKKHL